MDLSFSNLVGGLLFSTIGFVAFSYGKKRSELKMMGLGGCLMVYTFFVPNALWTWLVGLGLTTALWFFRD